VKEGNFAKKEAKITHLGDGLVTFKSSSLTCQMEGSWLSFTKHLNLGIDNPSGV